MTKTQAHIVSIFAAAKAGKELVNLSHLPQKRADEITNIVQIVIEHELNKSGPFDTLTAERVSRN